jgi:hypothetical protein
MPSPPRVSSKRIVRLRLPFTKAERALIARLDTPAKVQRWLNALTYNTEKAGETQRSFRPVVRSRTCALHGSRALRRPSCSNSTATHRS